MKLKIRRAAVLGSGVMGAQIAAHLAAAGVRTYLLDLASAEPPADKAMAKAIGKNFRSARSVLAIENLKVLKPSPLYSSSFLQSIIPGNFEDDMSVIAECDWVIEAVIERMDIKQGLHKKIAEYAKPGIPVTTNTSGLNLSEIVKDLPEAYASRFFGTHFFNPPRYMRLLEIIPHELTNPQLLKATTDWIEERLGKGIVHARDTVNFIANRIGVFGTQSTLKHMAAFKINVETVDELTGPLVGRAKSATLRTMDVVGLDTFMAVARNTYQRAPNDPYRDLFVGPKWIEELIEKGSLGQKTNSVGIYKKDKDAKGKTEILSYRPETKTYESAQPQRFAWSEEAAKERDTVKRIKLILSKNDDGATFVWNCLRDVFSYSAFLLEEIAGGLPQPVDDALKWGFNWEYGPFELWQSLGFDDILGRMKKDNAPLPAWIKPGIKFYANDPASLAWAQAGGPGQQFLATKNAMVPVPTPSWNYRLPQSENKADKRVVLSNKGASIVDVGDGVATLTFHSKMNAIDHDLIEMMQKAVAVVHSSFDGLVIANDAANFSAGANLKLILEAITSKKWEDIDRLLRNFQGALQLIKFAPFPSISCPVGMTLGGGCEVALHTTERVAAAETYAGLVEMGVGLIPAGGGTKELALRSYELAEAAEKGDPMQFLQKAFFLIGMARVSSSAHEAVEMGLFPRTTSISLSREHTMDMAKRHVISMVRDGYIPRSPVTALKVVGDPGIQTFRMALYNMAEGLQISQYDAFIGTKVATVLCGGEVDGGSLVSEQYLLDLERKVFIELCQQEKTAARIESMLKTGKPLRN
jgi:3-hydroxyacyl-CoA dehydrogenase